MHSQSCCLRFLLNPFWWESDVKQGAWQPLQVPPCTTSSVGGVLSAHGRHKGLANLAHQVLVCKLCSTNNWIHRSWLVCLWKLSQVTSKVTHNWLIWGDWLILVWGVLGVTAICDLRLSTFGSETYCSMRCSVNLVTSVFYEKCLILQEKA